MDRVLLDGILLTAVPARKLLGFITVLRHITPYKQASGSLQYT